MREILFRGKRLDNGLWVEGFFCNETCDNIFSPMYEQANIIRKGTGFWHPIDPATVGQYTGLTDKNGKKIFEGDIVKFTDSRFRYSYVGVVCFYEGSFCIKFKGFGGDIFHRIGEKEKWQEMGASGTLSYQYEILGNAYDNPELLEEVQ